MSRVIIFLCFNCHSTGTMKQGIEHIISKTISEVAYGYEYEYPRRLCCCIEVDPTNGFFVLSDEVQYEKNDCGEPKKTKKRKKGSTIEKCSTCNSRIHLFNFVAGYCTR